MSKSVNIEVPDEVYRVLQKLAKETGKSMELLAAEWVSKYGPRPVPLRSDAQRRAARQNLLRFAGMHKGNDPQGSQNERIDADLVREYGDAHEPNH